jgi:hypothetical protein
MKISLGVSIDDDETFDDYLNRVDIDTDSRHRQIIDLMIKNTPLDTEEDRLFSERIMKAGYVIPEDVGDIFIRCGKPEVRGAIQHLKHIMKQYPASKKGEW